MRNLTRLLIVGLVFTMLSLALGCAEEKEETTAPPPPVENAYVGSAVCASCHSAIATTFAATGHRHMLTAVNGQKPGAPLLLPDQPPAGLTWADIKYVVGGFGWKARFVTQDQQLVVGDQVEYDVVTPQFTTPAWAPYHAGQPTAYGYSCLRCHATGPVQASNTFAEAGVQCEACHGMGKFHVQAPSSQNIVEDNSALLCGGCHALDPTATRIPATGTFINNEGQYTEFLSSPHAEQKCTTCHAPHQGIRQGQTGGIVAACISCHADVTINHPVPPGGHPDCVDCHMSRATLSARSVNKYQGDVRTHIFKIHHGPEDQTQMFETVGGATYVKQDYGVTLDFPCYQCHKDPNGVGGTRSTQTLEQLFAKAPQIHGGKAWTGR